jgi:hypothetical protein
LGEDQRATLDHEWQIAGRAGPPGGEVGQGGLRKTLFLLWGTEGSNPPPSSGESSELPTTSAARSWRVAKTACCVVHENKGDPQYRPRLCRQTRRSDHRACLACIASDMATGKPEQIDEERRLLYATQEEKTLHAPARSFAGFGEALVNEPGLADPPRASHPQPRWSR